PAIVPADRRRQAGPPASCVQTVVMPCRSLGSSSLRERTAPCPSERIPCCLTQYTNEANGPTAWCPPEHACKKATPILEHGTGWPSKTLTARGTAKATARPECGKKEKRADLRPVL